MYRFLVAVALFSLLAHTSAWKVDTSLPDLTGNLFDYSADANRYDTDKIHDAGSWPTYEETLEKLSDPKGWMERTYIHVKDKVKEYIYSEEFDVADPRPTPPYENLCTPSVPFGYEARNYSASVWVSVDIMNRFSDIAVLYGKEKLEQYFNGNNDQNVTIPMTTPLRMKRTWPKSSFPGVDEMTFTYSLYLPLEFHDSPPKPTDTDVIIHREPATKYFGIKFSSYTFSFRNFEELFNLEDLLNQRKERFLSREFFVDVYDPSSKDLNRRNEVLVLMSPNVPKPTCDVMLSLLKFLDQKQPKFKELCKKSEKYEAKQYSESVWVSVTVNSISSQIAELKALPLLDKYFNKYNDHGVMIPKTEPVRLTQKWPSSSLFNPWVYQDYTFSYFVPLDPTTPIPQPLDNNVLISIEPTTTFFSLEFSGYTFDYNNMKKLQELKNLLNDQGEDYVGSEPLAIDVYNPPSVIFNRHNEVLVQMDPHVTNPKCATKAFPPCLHRGKECPSYRVMENVTANVERRYIAGNLYVMKRTGTCNMSQAYNDAYMPLHRYFRGSNNDNETIGRTTPVILVHKSTKNPPKGCDFTYNLMFYLPADRHLNAPDPTEEGVEFKRDEAKEVFVITFEDSTTNQVVTDKEMELLDVLDVHDLCYSKEEVFIATYDAPWRPKPHRHELWVPQAECTVSPSVSQGPTYIIPGTVCGEGVECPSYDTVRSYDTFEERNFGESIWVCKNTVSCNEEQAFNESISSLYEYFTSSYDVEPVARPFISFMRIPDLMSTRCNKRIETCAYLPETEHRLPLLPPLDDLTLLNIPSNDHPWLTAYVATVQGPQTVANIQSSITTLLQEINKADLFHSNRVYVARYTVPWDITQQRIEVGALTDTLTYTI